ncbi:MAG: hypothetical protein OEW12_06530 [Deltaproteobacteria bacterium]|nr:hypothetical protein [Deltaproteobacteria bacterium]
MNKHIPAGAYRFEISATFNEKTLPRRFRAVSSLLPQQWAKVIVEEGELDLVLENSKGFQRLNPRMVGIVPPGEGFKLVVTGGGLVVRLEYFHESKVDDQKVILDSWRAKAG